MRKVLATLIVLGPLLAGCGSEEPIVPELGGRWTSPQLIKAVQQAADRPQATSDFCNLTHVTFGKSRIATNTFGIPIPLFDVTDVTREGTRLFLYGMADSNGNPRKLVLMLRAGEVRFEDIYDRRGRSVKDERLSDSNQMRKYGATTLGEAYKLFLDVKPCSA